jgi:hypothetical protein
LLARDEAESALEWITSDACPPDERQWAEQLQDVLADATEMLAGMDTE